MVLKGSMTMEQRDRMIQAFTRDPSVTVFLMSLKAGGARLISVISLLARACGTRNKQISGTSRSEEQSTFCFCQSEQAGFCPASNAASGPVAVPLHSVCTAAAVCCIKLVCPMVNTSGRGARPAVGSYSWPYVRRRGAEPDGGEPRLPDGPLVEPSGGGTGPGPHPPPG